MIQAPLLVHVINFGVKIPDARKSCRESDQPQRGLFLFSVFPLRLCGKKIHYCTDYKPVLQQPIKIKVIIYLQLMLPLTQVHLKIL